MLGDGFLLILQMANAFTLKAHDESKVGGTALEILLVSTLDATHGSRLPCVSRRVCTVTRLTSEVGAGVGVQSSSEPGLHNERPQARSLRTVEPWALSTYL